MKVLVRYFVDKAFCGKNASKGSMTCQKVKIYLFRTLVKQRISHLVKVVTQISTLKIFWLKVYKLREKEQKFCI